MSWQATAWVATVEAGGASGKLLLYALANYADEHGRCWPSDARLMQDTELSERAIRDWKRRLEEVGLIKVERRRGSGGTFQADEIRLSMEAGRPCQPPANSAGGATGKSCRDHRQMVPSPPANGANPPTPPYKAEPSEEPPLEPTERERGREGSEEENPKSAGRAFERAYREWPTSIADSRAAALEAWLRLTAEERRQAAAEAARYVEAAKATGRKHVCSYAVYLREKRWEQLPPATEAEIPTHVEAPPFGPLWQAARMKQLVTGPKATPPGLTAFEQVLVGQGKADAEDLRRQKQARHGWPAVNHMHGLAEQRRGVTASVALERLAGLMEAVPVGSERWEEWRLEHELRGWPWLPDPGSMPVVYFPAGGPAKLSEFEQAVRGTDNDGGERQAAE